MKKSLFFVIAFFVVTGMWVTSCTENKPTGLIGPGKIQLTATPTPTPDVNYVFKLHQEETPASGVQVTLLCADKSISLKAETDEKGEAAFKVNEYGTYTVSVDSFDGFKSQVFPVDPIGLTYTAIDYGIPRLELELVEGSELIPLHETTLKYKVTYRTKFERPVIIDIEAKKDITVIYSVFVLKNDEDEMEIDVIIPKSFEKYNSKVVYDSLERQSYEFDVKGTNINAKKVVSNKRFLVRDWWFTFVGQMHYMAVYDDGETTQKMSFYTGIKNPNIKYEYNLPLESSKIKYMTIEAKNDEGQPQGSFTNMDDKSAPDFTGFGWFKSMGRIKTSLSKDYAYKINGVNGYMNVFITDGQNLSVTRTVRADIGWGPTCYRDGCRQSYDSFRRGDLHCAGSYSEIKNGCIIGQHFISDIHRRRIKDFEITIK